MLYRLDWDKQIEERQVRDFIAALRSGKYRQCRGKLQKGDAYCAMGVWYEVSSFEVRTCFAGIYSWQIADWNDSGKSFAFIADKLEQALGEKYNGRDGIKPTLPVTRQRRGALAFN